MTIRQKLIAAFFGVTVIPLLVITLIVSSQAVNREFEQFNESSTKQIHEVDNAFNVFLQSVAQNVDLLTHSTTVKGADATVPNFVGEAQPFKLAIPTTGKGGDIYALFEQMGKTHPSYAYAYFGTGHGGYVQWPVSDLRAHYDPRTRGWFESGAKGGGKPVRTAAYFFPEDNTTIISTVQQFTADDGAQGVVGLDVSLNQLTETVKKVVFGKAGYLILVEDTGNVLADPRHPEHNFKSLDTLGGAYKDLATKEPGSYDIELDGKKYTANVYHSDALGWKYIGLIETSEILAGAKRTAWIIAGVGALLVAIFVAGGVVLSRLLVSPINLAAASLKDIGSGQGDLTRRLAVNQKDETGALASGFNGFVESIQRVVRDIRSSGQNVQSSASDIGKDASQLDDAAQRQSRAVEQVSIAFHQMVASANEVASNCNQAAQSAQAGENQASKGEEMIVLMVGQVNELGQRIQRATDSISELQTNTQNITGILATVRGIADQTNLLALNAAIEAARAGEQGRGFAVVADEVRSLANRTSESITQINSILVDLVGSSKKVDHEMQLSLEQSNQSVAFTTQVSAAFSGVQDAVRTIKSMTQEIATAASEQHRVAEEIDRHINGIHGDADQIAAISRRFTATTQSLTRVSGELNQLVSRFRVD